MRAFLEQPIAVTTTTATYKYYPTLSRSLASHARQACGYFPPERAFLLAHNRYASTCHLAKASGNGTDALRASLHWIRGSPDQKVSI